MKTINISFLIITSVKTIHAMNATADVVEITRMGATTKAQRLCSNLCYDSKYCHYKICQGCLFSCEPRICHARAVKCGTWCFKESQCRLSKCSGCRFCKEFKQVCPIAKFKDKTSAWLSSDTIIGSNWMHSGKPYFHYGPPVLVDLKGDNTLNYFNPMHAHPHPRTIKGRFELGLSKTNKGLQDISYRIKWTDSNITSFSMIDAHGSLIADLDGDGIEDIFISNGGGRGETFESEVENKNFDNWLFWGEKRVDAKTGDAKATFFVGGRDAARRAGVQMSFGRGRFNYLFDANGDGLLDIFSSQDRHVSNEIIPGILLINQGNRSWKEDYGMMEYTRTMMVTDADGDGLAEEFLLNRSFCYPFRKGPGVDPNQPDLGPYSDEVNKFCSTRPVGTNAVYRFNHATSQMEEISRKYSNFWAGKMLTQNCCRHETHDGTKDCNAISMASGDFDNDQRADHIMLYESKMVFFFSSDRSEGELPDNANQIGLEIVLPNYCSKSRGMFVVDFDNDGQEEILVSCDNLGTFLLYSRAGASKTSWTIQNGCNGKDSLGDLNNRFIASASFKEMRKFCRRYASSESDNTMVWPASITLCKKFKRSGLANISSFQGMSLVDLNNDGFMDVITANAFGHLRFFYNKPSDISSLNKFIRFKLRGNVQASSNYYGIGATVILVCVDSTTGKKVKQFREISSYQHHTDKYGMKDDRLIFGLGQSLRPLRVTVKWSDGESQYVNLQDWEFSIKSRPYEIEY